MFALFLATMTAMSSFTVDLSKMYVARQRNQLVSDLADLAAVNTPSPIVGTLPSATAVATARSVVTANGLDANRTTVSVTASPADASVLALKTLVADDIDLPIGLLSGGNSAIVSVASWAQPNAAGACFRSHLGPINIYNDAVVTAPACSAEARTYLAMYGRSRTTLFGATVGYPALLERPYLGNLATYTPAAGDFRYSATVTDTIATSTPVSGMLAYLNAMAGGWPYGYLSPVNPAILLGGTPQTLTGTTAILQQSVTYSSVKITNSTVDFTGNGAPDPNCATPTRISATLELNGTNTLRFASGCYVFGAAVNAVADSNSRFDILPGAQVVFVFRGTLTNATRARLGFGDASVYFNGGSIVNAASATLGFGNGPFYLWGGTLYNVANTSTLTFGNGPFYFYGGSVSNTGTMTLGNGPFRFQGGSMALHARSTTSFGVGNMDFYGGTVIAGGSAVTFGAGGSAASGSGAVSMYGGSFALTADTLTAIGTSFGFKGGTLSLLGVGTIIATAPTNPVPALGYRNLLFGVWGGAFNLYQSGGQVNTMSGLVYVPVSNSSIYGSRTITLPPGGCFGVIAGVVDIYQNSQINAAPCAGLTGSSSGSGMLVQ